MKKTTEITELKTGRQIKKKGDIWKLKIKKTAKEPTNWEEKANNWNKKLKWETDIRRLRTDIRKLK